MLTSTTNFWLVLLITTAAYVIYIICILGSMITFIPIFLKGNFKEELVRIRQETAVNLFKETNRPVSYLIFGLIGAAVLGLISAIALMQFFNTFIGMTPTLVFLAFISLAYQRLTIEYIKAYRIYKKEANSAKS